jgi:hypothetical protein
MNQLSNRVLFSVVIMRRDVVALLVGDEKEKKKQ